MNTLAFVLVVASLGAAPVAAMQARDPVDIVRRHVERRSADMVTELRDPLQHVA